MNFIRNLLASTISIDYANASKGVSGLAETINSIATTIFGLLVLGMVGVAIFLAFKMFTAADETKRKNAKGQLIYAIIGVVILLVMLILVPIISDAITSAINSGSK